MRYLSTRGGSPDVSLSEAIKAGLAPDGGLYVPEEIPRRHPGDFEGCVSLPRTAERLLAPFFDGDDLRPSLAAICNEAFAIGAPLRAFGTGDDFLLELFHGPTAAFKDFGAQFLAACLAQSRKPDDALLTVLVATSGDTGAAVAAAFHRREGFRVVILYPEGRVSARQAHALESFGDNVITLRVAGSFDDCQRMVKRALADRRLQTEVALSSANSISLGRWLPQMSYFAAAALGYFRERQQPLNFVIPTGNLGNATAAMLARAIGLPIGRIVLSTNANDVLPRYFAGEDYSPGLSVKTVANAMDVGTQSNFERLRWLIPLEADLRASIEAHAVADDTILQTIRLHFQRSGEALCPHTATAAHALRQLRERGVHGGWAVVATAHPSKFEAVVEPQIGQSVDMPAGMATLLGRARRGAAIGATDEDLRRHLIPG